MTKKQTQTTKLPTVVSAAELAGLIGVSPRSISDLAGRGIVVRAPGRSGYVLRESVRGHADHLRKLAGGRGGDAAIASQTAERARLLRLQADAIETKNALQRNALLDAGAVEKEWADMIGQSRTAVLAVPARFQQRAPHLTAWDISELDHELREALRTLGEGEANGAA
jgi:terminase small subunit / prophage DNA-packing protein